MKLNFIEGDVIVNTCSMSDNTNCDIYIIHVCNDIGKWGAGFVLSISKKWKLPELTYRNKQNYKLGDIDVCNVSANIRVVNMICQNGIRKYGDPKNKVYIKYEYLEICLRKVRKVIEDVNQEKHIIINMPRIGCGLAGGKWTDVEKRIIDVFGDISDLTINVYDY